MRLGVSLCGAAGEEEEGEGRRRGGRLFFSLSRKRRRRKWLGERWRRIGWGRELRKEIAGGSRTMGDQCEDLGDEALLDAGVLPKEGLVLQWLSDVEVGRLQAGCRIL